MDRKKYIRGVLKKIKIYRGRRYYKQKHFTHLIWNLYHLNDPIKKGEVIHHKSGDTLDDDIDNLEKMKLGEHTTLHNKSRIGSRNHMYGKKHTKEARRKIGESSKHRSGSKNPMYGKKHTKETKEKISKALTGSKNPMYGKTGFGTSMYGKKHTDEAKEKISKVHKGKKVSSETRRKLSRALVGRKLSEETKRKISITKSQGIL